MQLSLPLSEYNALLPKAYLADDGLTTYSPVDGAPLAQLAVDEAESTHAKILRALAAQQAWQGTPWQERCQLVERYAGLLKEHRQQLARLITLDAGKTPAEALAEVDSSADVLIKTIKDASLTDLGGMQRRKKRPPAGLIGLITSFNFPLVVAQWTMAPAFLAGNAVVWKPSEKTPLVALAAKTLFDQAAGERADLLQLLIGGREVGEALVSHEQVDMISATGSVAMGQGIKRALTAKRNNAVPPILELGGNNGVVISQNVTPEHLEWSLTALMQSFLGTTGQRCTNTRRLIVHRSLWDAAVENLTGKVKDFIASGAIQPPSAESGNAYGYGPLIDADGFHRFEQAKQAARAEGGELRFGARLLEGAHAHAYYVEPALALMPVQGDVMYQETFAPLLFLTPYDGGMEEAVKLVNAPDNAGLVNGIYTLSRRETDYFAAHNEAGHSVINSPKGTGTPAYGMGFGGNKASGEGEILNAADPLRPFTLTGSISRVAQHADIALLER